jgi:hypothetical protein
MRAGPVEATFAEFDFARFLYLHDIAFRFVAPSGVKGKDYDFAIRYVDGRNACADAKCRLEGTEVRAEAIKNSLSKARSNNLPPDAPGVIFVKVPQTWLEKEHVRKGIYAAVHEFLRDTRRVVSVVVYATVVMEVSEQKMTLLRHRFHEFLNSSHRFDKTKHWALFKRRADRPQLEKALAAARLHKCPLVVAKVDPPASKSRDRKLTDLVVNAGPLAADHPRRLLDYRGFQKAVKSLKAVD